MWACPGRRHQLRKDCHISSGHGSAREIFHNREDADSNRPARIHKNKKHTLPCLPNKTSEQESVQDFMTGTRRRAERALVTSKQGTHENHHARARARTFGSKISVLWTQDFTFCSLGGIAPMNPSLFEIRLPKEKKTTKKNTTSDMHVGNRI